MSHNCLLRPNVCAAELGQTGPLQTQGLTFKGTTSKLASLDPASVYAIFMDPKSAKVDATLDYIAFAPNSPGFFLYKLSTPLLITRCMFGFLSGDASILSQHSEVSPVIICPAVQMPCCSCHAEQRIVWVAVCKSVGTYNGASSIAQLVRHACLSIQGAMIRIIYRRQNQMWRC